MGDSATPERPDAPAPNGTSAPSSDNGPTDKAARLLQRRFRGYQSEREASGLNLSSSRRRAKASEAKSTSESRPSADSKPSDSRPSFDKAEHESQAQPTDRWAEALKSHDLDNARKDANEGKNDAASRWQRGGMYAQRLTGGDAGEEEGEGAAAEPGGSNQKLLCVASGRLS